MKVRFPNADIKPPTGTTIGAKDCIDVNVANTTAIPVAGKLSVVPGANTAGNNVQSTVSTVKTETVPAQAVGFILMADNTNTTNIRWRVGATAAVASGQQLEPGRDTGYIPVAANISLIAESGTCSYNLQWVLTA